MIDKTFDAYADRYDAWYETEAGKVIFEMEVDCIKPFLLGYGRPYLEIRDWFRTFCPGSRYRVWGRAGASIGADGKSQGS